MSVNVFSQESKHQKHTSNHEKQESILLIGAGPTIELREQILGVNGRFYYANNEHFCFGPEISIFPFQEVTEEEEVSIIDLNLNAHYIFELGKGFGFYPLSGINYSIEKIRFLEEEEKEEEFGINYGVGFHYKWNKVFFFAEVKGIIGPLNDGFVTTGAIIGLPL